MSCGSGTCVALFCIDLAVVQETRDGTSYGWNSWLTFGCGCEARTDRGTGQVYWRTRCENHKMVDRLSEMNLVRKPGAGSYHYMPEPFYLIGTHRQGGKVDLPHEKAHGRFYVYPEYRQVVLDRVRAHNTKPLAKFLLDLGYSKWTLEDEIHAYALTGWPEGFKPNGEMKALRSCLQRAQQYAVD